MEIFDKQYKTFDNSFSSLDILLIEIILLLLLAGQDILKNALDEHKAFLRRSKTTNRPLLDVFNPDILIFVVISPVAVTLIRLSMSST